MVATKRLPFLTVEVTSPKPKERAHTPVGMHTPSQDSSSSASTISAYRRVPLTAPAGVFRDAVKTFSNNRALVCSLIRQITDLKEELDEEQFKKEQLRKEVARLQNVEMRHSALLTDFGRLYRCLERVLTLEENESCPESVKTRVIENAKSLLKDISPNLEYTNSVPQETQNVSPTRSNRTHSSGSNASRGSRSSKGQAILRFSASSRSNASNSSKSPMNNVITSSALAEISWASEVEAASMASGKTSSTIHTAYSSTSSVNRANPTQESSTMATFANLTSPDFKGGGMARWEPYSNSSNTKPGFYPGGLPTTALPLSRAAMNQMDPLVEGPTLRFCNAVPPSNSPPNLLASQLSALPTMADVSVGRAHGQESNGSIATSSTMGISTSAESSTSESKNLAVFNSDPCAHDRSYWKHLRTKAGLRHMVCTLCGHKWRQPTNISNAGTRTAFKPPPGRPPVAEPQPSSFTAPIVFPHTAAAAAAAIATRKPSSHYTSPAVLAQQSLALPLQNPPPSQSQNPSSAQQAVSSFANAAATSGGAMWANSNNFAVESSSLRLLRGGNIPLNSIFAGGNPFLNNNSGIFYSINGELPVGATMGASHNGKL